MNVLDLSQDFCIHTPAFAGYDGPSIKWVKRLAFEKAGGQEITTTLHVGTHLDAPAHFFSGGKFIGDLPLEWLIGPACVVDLERMGLGDYDLYGPEHFERWECDDRASRIERDDILIIHTGYHRYYPENWAGPERGRRDAVLHPSPGPDARVRRVGARARHPLAGRRRRQRRPPDEHGDPPVRADEAEDAEAEARSPA